MQLVRTQCLQQLSQLRANPVTQQLHWSVVFSIRFFLFQRMEEGVTIEEGIGDTNMLEIVLVELVGNSYYEYQLFFSNLANFYRDK